MPRGVFNRKPKQKTNGGVTEQPAEVTTQITIAAFTELPWWEKLNINEQSTVVNVGQSLASAMLAEGQARMEIGKYLLAEKDVLEPHNLFQKFLRRFTKYSIPTAYRYIRRYENAVKSLPPAVVKAAMVRGIDIAGATDAKPLGIYTEAAAKVAPLPPTATATQANAWLDKVEEARKVVKAEKPYSTGDPELSKREVVRFAVLRHDALPNSKKTRGKWEREVVGLLMAKWNLTTEMLQPVPVPADYDVHRGRPRLIPAAA